MATPRLDRVQDLAAGRRLGDARRDLGGGRRARRLRRGLAERPPDRPGRRARRAELRGADAARRARPPRARARRSATPSCRTRSATRRSSPRRRRSSTTRPAAGSSSGLGAGWHEGEHVAVRDPAAADRASGSTGSSRPSRRHPGAVLRRPPRRDAGRHPGRSVLPARRRDEPAAAADARAARRSGSAARSRAGSRSRPGAGATAGCCRRCPSRRRRLLRRASASAILRELDAIGRDPAGFDVRGPGRRPATTPTSRRAALEAAARFAGPGRPTSILGMPAGLGPAGLDAVAREVAEPLREAARMTRHVEAARAGGRRTSDARDRQRPTAPAATRERRTTPSASAAARGRGPRRPVHRRAAATRTRGRAEREERRYLRLLVIMVVRDRRRRASSSGSSPARRSRRPRRRPRLTVPRRPPCRPPRSTPATLGRARTTSSSTTLRDLIRIPSVNPPPADAPDGELRAAALDRRRARRRRDPGRRSSSRCPAAARWPPGSAATARAASRSCCCQPPRRRARAAAELWTHDPFAGDVADGYVWGRGAVDMKDLVAMELTVIRLLAAEARAAGRDPATRSRSRA